MELIIAAGFLLLSAFFNGSETAFISINKVKLYSRLENGYYSARILTMLAKSSESVIGGFLIGVNICDVAVVLIFNVYLAKLIGPGPLVPLYSTLILTPVIAVFATLFPKIIFREYADEIMSKLSYLYLVIYILLYPFQFIFVRTVKFLLQIMGLKKKKTMFSKDEFGILLDMTTEKGILKQSEKEIIESIMKFRNIKAREIMVPLIRMTCVEENDTVEIASALMLSTGHTRLPVFRIRVDNMLGYIENKDLLAAVKHDRVSSYIREGIIVPESAPINRVLVGMQNAKAQIAFVVDEYGGVMGAISNQDIITEIIGEFVEMKGDWIKKEGEAYIVNGMIGIDEINELLNLKIKKSDFETAAGFMLHELENIPSPGDSIEVGKFIFEVYSATNVRIKQIKIYPRTRKASGKSKKRTGTKHEH
jgi:CBS domain containing-hemolysin-like protein